MGTGMLKPLQPRSATRNDDEFQPQEEVLEEEAI
jgi:hypothetical protein